jgi:cbb3-type cytochrome oxidase subunit 3
MPNDLDAMLEMATSIAIVLGFLVFICLCAWMFPTMTEAKRVDCAMAEFSPDVSLEIKQLCREARSKK